MNCTAMFYVFCSVTRGRSSRGTVATSNKLADTICKHVLSVAMTCECSSNCFDSLNLFLWKFHQQNEAGCDVQRHLVRLGYVSAAITNDPFKIMLWLILLLGRHRQPLNSLHAAAWSLCRSNLPWKKKKKKNSRPAWNAQHSHSES